MSGGVRKQLGPVKKRLQDQVDEGNKMIGDAEEDLNKLLQLRSKVAANVRSHGMLVTKLSEIANPDDSEEDAINAALNEGMNLQLDANEVISLLADRISVLQDTDQAEEKIPKRLEMLEEERLAQEIENLQLEKAVKKAKLDVLRDKEGTKVEKFVKPPTLELPKFSGDILEWPTFWDSFEAVIVKDGRFSDINKFKYLQSCLEGEALETLSGFKLSGAKYDVAVKLLKERYEDMEYIIHSHYNALSKMKRSKNTTSQLRRTYNSIESHVRSLEVLDEDVENNHLVAVYKSKFPEEFNLKLEERREDTSWTVASLRKMIEKFISAREKSEQTKKTECSENSDSSNSENEDSSYSSEGLFSKENKIKCVFCTAPHWADECQKFKTVSTRKQQLKGRCYICLSKNHLSRTCQSQKQCFYCKKKNSHHSSLCMTKFADIPEDDDDDDGNENLVVNIDKKVVMKTAKIFIQNPSSGRQEEGIILFDSGSKSTYITEEKARSLRIKQGRSKYVNVNTFGSEDPSKLRTMKTTFNLKQVDGKYKKIDAKICKEITGPIKKSAINLEKYNNIWKHLKLADELPDRKRTIRLDVLVGNDYYEDIMKGDKIQIDKGLYLVNSSFGWMFSGRIESNDGEEEEIGFLVDEDVAKVYWELETIGVQNTTDTSDDDHALELVRKSISKNGDRYQVGWPWKISKYELPSNYQLARSRLKSLFKNFKNENQIKNYDLIIKKQLDDGVIEKADMSKKYVQSDLVVTHYVPHHVVGTEKPRVVYEGCAKSHQSKKSLNECLYRGPNLVKDLVGTLIRWRINPIAITADIQKAYLQLQLAPADRDVVRFLWVKDIMKPISDNNIIAFRFCRVIWGIVSASFLLSFAINYHLSCYECDVARAIRKNIYVDNLVDGAMSSKAAINYYKKTKQIFSEGSMNMCKWSSNSDEMMINIKPEDRCDDEVVKVLGILWSRKADMVSLVKLRVEFDAENVTKRSILKTVASVHDPLGLFSPSTLQAKLLIQHIWKEKLGWDDKVSEAMKNKWMVILKDLHRISEVSLKRYIENTGMKDVMLITFVDASKDAYAAVSYLKSVDKSEARLVFSKTRLAPIQGNLTIPRLELLALTIGVRISKFLIKELELENAEKIIFTDSRCVLEWCKTGRDLSRFVGNRIKEIRDETGIRISYVKSSDNPADLATRGKKAKQLQNDMLWWHGPTWLKEDLSKWPNFEYAVTDDIRKAVETEEKHQKVLFEIGLIQQENDNESPFGIKEGKYSSYSKLIRITAWCMRFIENSKKVNIRRGHLAADELESASHLWIRRTQETAFQDVIDRIKTDKKHQMIKQLGLYLDDSGLLRCAGRFLKDHPNLLPKDNHFTKLCIVAAHRRLLHAGVAHTLAEVRKESWIVRGRSSVGKVLRHCLICLHWEGGPFKTPPFAPLPEYVVSDEQPPFTYVGIDYFGPLITEDNGTKEKRWVCLFTCLNIRAIHLELVDDMTTEQFLFSFRRFVSRRGSPKLIISDNAKNFKLASKIVAKTWEKIYRSDKVQAFASENGIIWKFISEYSPWKGGFYERLIGLTKSSLRKSLGKMMLSRTEMETILAETEAVVNSRPLVYIDNDINSGLPLTPGHFLSTNADVRVPSISDIPYDLGELAVRVVKNWKYHQGKLKQFWKIWLSQYLQAIRERSSLGMKPVKGEIRREPIVGEIVHIRQVNQPRGKWTLAKVEALIKSDVDDRNRVARLKLPSGDVVKRPYRLLYPIESNI